VKANFPGIRDEPIAGKVAYISPESDGRCALALSFDEAIESVRGATKISACVTKNETAGLKIPIESIHFKDSQSGVYVLQNDAAKFKSIDVVAQNSDYAVIRDVPGGVKLYDEVIVNCRNLEDGRVVERQ
jgi:multidrug efflux pump subunit AcrA (membrane-fusion protein)